MNLFFISLNSIRLVSWTPMSQQRLLTLCSIRLVSCDTNESAVEQCSECNAALHAHGRSAGRLRRGRWWRRRARSRGAGGPS